MDIKYIKVGKWYNVPFKVVEIKSGDIHMENGGIKAVCQPSELSEITARQDVRPEHSTGGTLSHPERVWNDLIDVLFDDDGQKYAEDLSKAMRNHIKSITPDNENVTKNTETAPKYDPNRKFRKGDKVKLVARDGRSYIDYDPTTKLREGAFYTVLEDESDVIEGGCPAIRIADEHAEYEVLFYFLELVTPVEELEISRVFNDKKMGAWIVTKDNFTHAYFPYRCEVSDNIANSKEEAKACAEAERDRLNAEYRKEQK